ncbi:MAG: tRNA dihydrouridine synthase DusB [bacterium]
MDIKYASEINQHVLPAKPAEFRPARIGPLTVWPPVVLAPMAGITNAPFRTLCREFGAGLYVSEMVTARLLVSQHPRTLRLASFAPDEKPRSLQLYGVDPVYVGEAVNQLVAEHRVDHIDLNFGCPVRKVTIKGGGAAIPLKPNLLRNIVRAAVKNAGRIPVTIKFRLGINERYLTYLTAGRIAEEEGCAAVALHARTAAQLYQGDAQWQAIANLKSEIRSIPVLGNGDIWEAYDALRMMRSTGCDGVVVGRGCLGRPWLFRDLVDVFEGRDIRKPPTFGQVVEVMLEHARLLCDWLDEDFAIRSFRKHCTWYVKGFKSAPVLLEKLVRVSSFAALQQILKTANPDEPFPLSSLRKRRGKRRGKQKVALPQGYLDNLDDDSVPYMATEEEISGG